MSILHTAIVLAEETAAEGSQTPAWVFGITALAVLGALLVVTLMLKVDR